MRKYKIVEEKRPTEDFTRWLPMVIKTITPSGQILDEVDYKWDNVFIVEERHYTTGYVKAMERAREIIDKCEMGYRQREGAFIVSETEYKPKQK